MVYEPAEDSQLLRRNISKYTRGIVCDMGTGSGILAEEAKNYSEKVYACDIDKKAVSYVKKNVEGVEAVESNLFSYFKGKDIKFDTIIFNPPYLPKDKNIDDPALYGGKKGYEIIQRFFDEVTDFMKEDTKILLLFSTHTKKEKVEEIIHSKCMTYQEIDRENMFFERLFVYLVEKSELLKEFENKNIKNINYFAKGKRGILYKGELKGEEVIVKTKNPDSEAIGRIKNEVDMLKRLNIYNIGPKFLFSGENYLVYFFAKGVMFPEYIKENNKEKIIKVLEEIFSQLQKLDDLGINKEEMHKPNKHIVIGKQVTMIDFERARFTQKPQNITQFVKYLTSGNIRPILQDKSFTFQEDKLIDMSKNYRQGKLKAEQIIEYIKNGI